MTREEWSRDLLMFMALPRGRRNLRAMIAWTSAEGTAAKWNPLATTLRMPGSTNFNSVGVQNYADLETGLRATARTLREPGHGYKLIVDRLEDSAPSWMTLRAVERSEWGTGGLALDVLESMRDDYDLFASKPIGK